MREIMRELDLFIAWESLLGPSRNEWLAWFGLRKAGICFFKIHDF